MTLSFRTLRTAVARPMLLAVVVAALACSGQSTRDPDANDNRDKAQRLKMDGKTTETLDEAKNDRVDWRYWEAERSGRGELRVSLSQWEEASNLTAMVSVRDDSGAKLVQDTPLNKAQREIKEGFNVEAGRKYYVVFTLVSGKGEFFVEMGEPLSPCAACTDKQECVDNRCVDKPCGGGCPEGQVCNKDKNECVKAKEKSASAPRPKPAESAAPVEEKKDASISCAIIDARDQGAGSVLTLSAGESKGVKKGMTGSVKGVKGGSFRIIEVYPSRSKASCSAPTAKIGDQKGAVIRP